MAVTWPMEPVQVLSSSAHTLAIVLRLIARHSHGSQEYSYTKNRLLSSIFFAAKTLPVKRGAGIDHKVRVFLTKVHPES